MFKLLVFGTLTDEMNGSARSFIRLCNLMSSKSDVTAVVPDSAGVVSMLDSKVDIRTLDYSPIRRSLSSAINLPVSMFNLYRLIKQVSPDLIHINDIPWFYGIAIGKQLNIPVTIHSRYYEENKFVRKVISRCLAKASLVVHVSDYNRRLWSLPQNCNSVTLHNPGIFKFDLESSFSQDLPEKYILIVSRVAEEKGVKEAILIFLQLASLVKDLSLVIAGDAIYPNQHRYKNECEELVKKSGLGDRVYWLGKVQKPHSLYVNASAFIHVPRFEDPFPTTIMEALALGCRIITNRKGGIPEQVEYFDGVYHVSDGNINSNELIDFLNKDVIIAARREKYNYRFGEDSFVQRFDNLLASKIT